MHRLRRSLFSLALSVALSLVDTPALAAREPSDAQCWADVVRSDDDARLQWVEEHPTDAAAKFLSVLEISLACGEADPDQTSLVFRALRRVLVDLGGYIRPSESQVHAVHIWHSRFVDDPPLTSEEMAEITAKYTGFSVAHPPKAELPVKPQDPDPPGPTDTEQREEIPDSPPDPNGVARQKQARNLQIGGAGLLALGAGSLVAGFVSLGRVVAQSRALAELCRPACTNAVDAAPLVRRGELYEDLTPALLTLGATIAIVGGVLVGVGTKRRSKPPTAALVPLLTPRFAGASWTLHF